MQQLDNLAINGKSYHYRIDTGLFLLAFHAKEFLTADHVTTIQSLRNQIGQMPSGSLSAGIAKAGLALLNDLRREIPGPTYSAIYGQFNDALSLDLAGVTITPYVSTAETIPP